MIASLMMYGRPELAGAHGRYWQLIRGHLATADIDSPPRLNQTAEEFSVWNNPALVLSQTCGMPYRTQLHEHVTLVGTPDFGVTNCPPGYYRSALVVRRNDPRKTLPEFESTIFAYNQTFSQSGYGAPFWHLKPHGFWFKNRLHTQQHLEAARAVAAGRADIASIDAVTWRLMQRYEDFVPHLTVLEWTAPTPGLPYIAAQNAPQQATFNAIAQAITDLAESDRKLLGLRQIVYIPPETYLAVPNPDP